MVFHTVDFATISILAPYYSEDIIEIISVLFFIGAVGKSAQVGLHT
jgi:NADH:ubiquinone oxidoreductase subunit 5 (subunit L)/multisubunit Na+/H+ antiporter MnhA subunit